MKHFTYYRSIGRIIVFVVLISLITGMFMPSCMMETKAVDNQTYTISATCNDGGIISPKGNKTCYAGENQTYTFSPNFGYVIEDVVIDGVSKGVISEYTFYQVEGDHTLSVAFSRRSGDLNEDGVCDSTDVELLRQAFIWDEPVDVNRDGCTSASDLIRSIRQKTLLGKALESPSIWKVSNPEAIQINGSEMTFNGSGNALTVQEFGQDYSVSAQVTLEGRLTGTNGIFSLIARRSGSSYYDYRLRYYSGSLYVDLYRYGTDGVVTELVTYSKNYIQNKIGYRVFAVGESLTMRLLCKGNTIYCFINECLIGSYVDEDATAPQTGVVGVKVNNVYGSVAGFEVQSADAIQLCNINTKDDGLYIYEGESLDNEQILLDGVCVDGTVLTGTLNQAILSDYDNSQVGKSKIDVALLGNQLPLVLTVAERRTKIDEISNKLESIDLEKLDVSTRELLQQYDGLSEYEKTFCSDYAVAKHKEAIQRLALGVSEINDDILVVDTFSDESVKWDSGVELQGGKAFRNQTNGRYQIDQTKYGLATNCWRTAKDVYGEIHSVSADMVSSTVYSMLGLSINVGSSGYYYARVAFHTSADGGAADPTVKLFKKLQSAITLQTVNLKNYGIYLSPNSWFNMSITYDEGIIGVYIDGKKVIEYDDTDAVEQFSYGSAGVYTYAGDCRFDNIVICGEKIQSNNSPSNIETSYYEQDFEQEELGETVDEWMQKNTDNSWKTTSSNAAYQITGTANYLSKLSGASAWTDYAVSCDVNLGQGTLEANTTMMIVARSTNTAKNGYEFGICEDTNGTTYLKLLKRATSNVQLGRKNMEIVRGRTYHLMLIVSENRIICYCDGVLIFDVQDNADPYLNGYAGLRSAGSGDAEKLYDNYVVYELAADDNLSCAKQERTVLFADDFANENKKMTEYGWSSDVAGTRGVGGDENYCLRVVADDYTNAGLYVFENNPTISMNFMYDEPIHTDADFGFEIRKSGDTAYVRIGYNVNKKSWYLQESACDKECAVHEYYFAAELSKNIWHSAKIIADAEKLQFVVDDEVVFGLDNISQVGYGKIAVYARKSAFYIDNVKCTFPSGDTVQKGIVEYYLTDDYAASFEIEALDDGNMIGVGQNLIAFSDDYGKTFRLVGDGEYEGLDAKGGYMSILRLHDGNHLFIGSTDFVVHKSTDNMKNWTSIGTVVPDEDFVDGMGRKQAILHINSLSEVKIDEDTWRILLPVAMIRYANDTAVSSSSTHYTVVYYSDDGGVNWKKSENDTRDIILDDGNASEWAEAKIVQCISGELRMYCSHSYYGCMQYTVSHDNGVTWQGLYQVPQMQCPVSSFSLTKGDDGLFYMVWVNDTPSFTGGVYGRGRLSLARSYDGANWEFLCDIERTASYVWSDNCLITTPIFQVVDPSITVTDDYVYVSYGFSDRALEFGNAAHNAQRIKVVRLEKNLLAPKEWGAYNVSDMTFTSTVELTKAPKTTFDVGDSFVYAGGEVVLTALNGEETILDTKRFYLLKEPDMSRKGTFKIVLYNRDGFSVSYEIMVQ